MSDPLPSRVMFHSLSSRVMSAILSGRVMSTILSLLRSFQSLVLQ